MPTRTYFSPVRSAAAAEKRGKVVRSATKFLRERDIAVFSLDAVAKAAGVTRLTVYNQFGSRKGLLEAVFDEIARKGGLTRLPLALETDDPREALHAVVGIFCEFWGSDAAVARLHDAIHIDQEFGEALLARNERRRKLLAGLVNRLAPPEASAPAKRGAVDLMFMLTSCQTYRSLSATQADKAVRRIIKDACDDAISRLAATG